MLEVGNNVFTTPEEQTHFSMLVIGGALKDTYTSISQASLDILKNVDVISYNQDSLGIAASFKKRWTESGYEVWSGPLSGGRTVVAISNLFDEARTLTFDLPDSGLQKAGFLKDIWNGVTARNILTSYTAPVEAHGTILLELADTTAADSYSTCDAATVRYVNLSLPWKPANYQTNYYFLQGIRNHIQLQLYRNISIRPKLENQHRHNRQ
jgi:alpha-galactosidase